MQKNTKKTVLTLALAGTSLLGQAKAMHLTPDMIIQAWKSEEYRQSLSAELRAQLPANPAGENILKVGFEGRKLASADLVNGTCDHGCPCTTYQMNRSKSVV